MTDSGGTATHFLILIDCHAEMFHKPPGGKSAMKTTLQLLYEWICHNIRDSAMYHTGKRNCVGIMFYNTRVRKAEETDDKATIDEIDFNAESSDDEEAADQHDVYERDKKGTVHTIIPLGPPGTKTVRSLRRAIEQHDEVKADYAAPEEPEEDTEMFSTLQHALQAGRVLINENKAIRTKTSKSNPIRDHIQVWIFSNQSAPHNHEYLAKEVSDILDERIYNIVLWGLPNNLQLFDYSAVFDGIRGIETPLKADYTEEQLLNLSYETIMNEFQKISKPSRPLMKKLPFLMPDWKDTGTTKDNSYWMDWYRLIQTRKKPNFSLRLNQEDGQPVHSLVQTVTAKDQDVLVEKIVGAKEPRPSSKAAWRLRSFTFFGNDRVKMSKDDLVAIKNTSNSNPDFVSFILTGFRPEDTVPSLMSIGQSFLVVPTAKEYLVSDSKNEDQQTNYQNNLAAMKILWQAMREEKVVAIGELLKRTSATSRMVVLWPLPNDADDDNLPPFGFIGTELPFAEEIKSHKERDGEFETRAVVSNDLEAAAVRLVQKQRVDTGAVEIGQAYVNGPLAEWWRTMEKYALHIGDDNSGEPDYDTTYKPEHVLALAKSEIEEFGTLLPQPEEKGSSSAGKKRVRVLEPDTSGLDWKDLLSNGGIPKLKVPELKAKLKSLGESSTGKKQMLVERLETVLFRKFLPVVKEEN